MPPRYAYWTILIDQAATAFRAREREELLPTFHQLKRKNADVVMKWFARGRLWESPAEAQAAQRAPKAPLEKRGRDWRPGGEHRDPRERFKKRSQPHNARPEPGRPRDKPADRAPARPWHAKPRSAPGRSSRPPWNSKSSTSGRPASSSTSRRPTSSATSSKPGQPGRPPGPRRDDRHRDRPFRKPKG